MYRQKIPNSGWAAFDRKWRGMDGRSDEHDVGSFPALSGSRALNSARSSVTDNNRPKIKPFASVIHSSVDFSAVGNKERSKPLTDHTENTSYCANSTTDNKVKLLKDAHSWADDNLIEDVLAGVNNDVGQASALLKAMVTPNLQAGEGITSGNFASEKNKIDNLSAGNAATDNEHPNGAHLLPLSMSMFSVPMEPEWEDLDDVYLNHRKDALKMMRAATHHSQAASNAFLRGGHAAARELSLRAQKERIAAERLNSRAADEIFRLRNSNNDIWKIDLHGLHASEAMAALERHLHKIEFQLPEDRAAISDEATRYEHGNAYSPYSGSINGSNVESVTKKVVFPRPRQAILNVITGIGKHSKGQASLPVAIRGFLIENGYRFDEARPGVLSVRPKFRGR